METEIDTFRHLNTDVLLQLFEHLRPDRGLRSLSMSCRWIRQETAPVLFRSCLVIAKRPICAERFLPPSLWPYVSHLSLRDDCPDMLAMKVRKRRLRFTDDPLLCGTMDPVFLNATLRAMPRLCSVNLAFHSREIHGMGWETLSAILSIPCLRSLTVAQFLFSPRQSPPDASLGSLAPLTTFRFEHRAIRRELRQYPLQEDTLGLVIGRLQHTLETLLLPNEVTPFKSLAGNRWPQMKELHLIGEFHPDPDFPVPFVALFAGMPKLRILRLKLSLPIGIDKQVLQLWPKAYHAQFPWPDLDNLTMSFPCFDDRIYSHLPQTMRHLSLRCTPHHCFIPWAQYYVHSPLPDASEMLEILSKVDTPHLERLEVEYRADFAEDDLLLCITKRFPQLTLLEIHRFRSQGSSDLAITDIALRLARLQNLRTLRAYLDTPEDDTGATLPQTATNILACKLARPDLRLWLLHPGDVLEYYYPLDARWYRYCLVPEQDINREPRAENDPSSHSREGVPTYPYND
ncbi:uncharacterized protein C8Q71DRAFT_372158 [Rhodofomes roseus]|uniref:F-box domain-containing protein n=1 Tax=Rhodofomes roseus TaxID=34475 RepID=A0ABQ8K0X1_9APHY|nr:uncharacterized protein C8Q71DRAFT_372158 [Rhodofomes roseus]KAH9830275.1 hypothetical protein C8Q71DRAFT_372158 [Rhodofomes roseus]